MQGFDQETAAVVMARYASLKMEMEVHLKLCCHVDVLGIPKMYHTIFCSMVDSFLLGLQ